MSKTRYSYEVCSMYCGLSVGSIQYRAKKLGIDTSMGISADELKRIVAVNVRKTMRHSSSIESLRKEMGAAQ